MSARSESSELATEGFYPVPTHDLKSVVARKWDGEVWTDEVRPAADGSSLPGYKRHFFRFLHLGGWKLFLVFLVSTGGAAALWATDRKAHVVSGIQMLEVPLAFIATLTVMIALYRLINRRVRFELIPAETRKSIFKWGVFSAVVGFAFALAIEEGVPRIFGGNVNSSGWMALAGPAEETGKLLIPVILWIKGRFRLPREGYLLVLVSAGIFGVMEGTEYAIMPEIYQPSRPPFEAMHPLLTGFAAAVVWQGAWRRGHLFTGAAIGAWVVAMAAHSTNDVIVFANHTEGALASVTSFITIAVVTLMYLLQKHQARQLVPPDNVGRVSPRWRPVAPRHATEAAQS